MSLFFLTRLPQNEVQACSQLRPHCCFISISLFVIFYSTTPLIEPCLYRRRLAVDGTPSHHMEISMLQQVVPRQEHYSQSRAVALQSVESTISELSGIFTHLATMVAQQGELAIRPAGFAHIYFASLFSSSDVATCYFY
ncbi:hypothetical protein CRYUN_Cryun09bG0108100 [Craigia yunnanensis]